MSGPAGTYGVLGVGTIAEAIVTGLCGGEATAPDIVVSPRGRARSAALAARFRSVWVAPDNQAVIDASDTVLICVRPPQAAEVLRPLRWRRGQSVVSVVAGLPVAALAGCVGPVTDIARAIRSPPSHVAARRRPSIHPRPRRAASSTASAERCRSRTSMPSRRCLR
jgi:pyrroline-5-carboxylate reductase